METAKAAVMPEFNQPLEIRQYPLPEEIEPGAALVKVEMAGICGTDVHLWKGQLPIPRPVILGHETVGTIVKLGQGLETDWTGTPLQTGDRVGWYAGRLCGHCYYCINKRQPTRCLKRKAYGITYNCDLSPHFLGGYAEYHYLHPGSAIFKLDDLSTETVIGAGCALNTAIHGVERMGISWGDIVVIQGSGPVGLSALAVAKTAGASVTIMIGGPAHRLELAKTFGADQAINIETIADAAERVQQVKHLSGGYGADAVIECVGMPAVVSEGLEMCRDGGKYLVLGHYGDAGATAINPHIITNKQLTVYGAWASEPRHMAAGMEFLRTQAERFPFDQLVSRRFALDGAFEALQTTARWTARKSVIAP